MLFRISLRPLYLYLAKLEQVQQLRIEVLGWLGVVGLIVWNQLLPHHAQRPRPVGIHVAPHQQALLG